jgi:hypothetical protein
MLGMRNYTQDHVDATRRRVDAHLSAYRALAVATEGGSVAEELAGFAPVFFNNMVIGLDAAFIHRLRVVEGKDGNPLNEVRALASSLLENDGVLTIEKSMKLKPDTSVLGLQAGDRIALDETAFVKLADAFFAEIEKRFVA